MLRILIFSYVQIADIILKILEGVESNESGRMSYVMKVTNPPYVSGKNIKVLKKFEYEKV